MTTTLNPREATQAKVAQAREALAQAQAALAAAQAESERLAAEVAAQERTAEEVFVTTFLEKAPTTITAVELQDPVREGMDEDYLPDDYRDHEVTASVAYFHERKGRVSATSRAFPNKSYPHGNTVAITFYLPEKQAARLFGFERAPQE